MAKMGNRGVGGKSSSIGTTPGRIIRIVLMAALFIGLGVLFLLIVLPGDREATPPPEDELSSPAKANEESKDDTTEMESEDDETYPESEIDEELTEADEGDAEADETEENEEKRLDYAGVYLGSGETEINEMRTVWEISMELSENSFIYIDGKISYFDDPVNGTGNELRFIILEKTFELTFSETGKDDIVVTSQFDGGKNNLFSINENRQFFLYVTPSKVNINMETTLLPKEILKAKEHTPLIDMSGFLKGGGIVVGMFHSPFVPTVEYQLERIGE